MDTQEAFLKRYNDNVKLFNSQLDQSGLPPHIIAVSAAYATARFSAWTAAVNTLDVKDLEARRAHAIDTILKGYRQMLDEHFDDFVKNYDAHFQHEPDSMARDVKQP